MTTYVVEYCFCAIAFLLVILWNCCTTRQFPGFAYRVFRTELFCALVDVIADVTGAYTIPLALSLPFWVNHVVNTVFYTLQLAIPALLLLYVLALERFRLRTMPVWLFAPVLAAEIVVLTNPLHGLMFSIDPVRGYQRGAFFAGMFACCLLYIALAFVMLNLHRARVNRKQYATISLFIALVISAAVAQFFRPELLLSGPAIAISITMLYLTIQKPGDMLDVTTGVFNRTALMEMVDAYVADKRDFQAAVLVLNHMARLDRIMGYESINRMMAEIGRFLNGAFPHSWVFSLSGSSVFVTLTRKTADYEAGLARLRARMEEPWLTEEYGMTLSATLLRVPRGAMLRSADEFSRLISYAADRAAEGEELALGEATLREVNRRAMVENALTEALAGDLIEVYLQPIYDVRARRFTHAEALVRLPWRGGMIPPGEFIPVAEQSGLVLRIDALALRKVCAFLRDADPALRVGVNLSAVELMRPTLADELRGVMAEYGVSPARVIFEITETAASGPVAETKKRMDSLRNEGFSFALDDFGTGFANITQVVQLPFDIAKLDRGILTASESDESGMAVLRSCIRMFKELDVRIVAEGAESESEVERLLRMDVDYIQGYYYAKPMPLDAARVFLAARGAGKDGT